MNIELIRLKETASTNDYLRSIATPSIDEMTVVAADHQTAGRGQGCNKWESEAEKNLLFSILTSPTSVAADRQFVLSMAGALALKATLDRYCEGISLKWPNDIYWHDRKISGTLIETSLQGKMIKRCIYGTGLNVNQREFHSDAPNPVSLYNIIGVETPLEDILDTILSEFQMYYQLAVNGCHDCIVESYNAALYRRQGMYPYQDTATGETFTARIEHVGTDGLLNLIDSHDQRRTYSLKEVKFISCGQVCR